MSLNSSNTDQYADYSTESASEIKPVLKFLSGGNVKVAYVRVDRFYSRAHADRLGNVAAMWSGDDVRAQEGKQRSWS